MQSHNETALSMNRPEVPGAACSRTAIAGYTRLIELPGAPAQDVAAALVSRGLAWSAAGDVDHAIADYTRVIEEFPGAPVEQRAKALYHRGLAWQKKGHPEREFADYTHVIDRLPDAPPEQLAEALVNRGVLWGGIDAVHMQLADYTRAIEGVPGAPAPSMALAHAHRGWVQYERGNYQAFLRDTQAALEYEPDQKPALFRRGLALLACGRTAEALAAYTQAAEGFPEAIEDEGLAHLKAAQTTWLSRRRARPIVRYLQRKLAGADCLPSSAVTC